MNNTLPVIQRREGAVAHLRFNRPDSLNAMDAGMANAFLAACNDIAEDSSVRAVVLSGEGKGFMAGGDLAARKANPQAIAKEIIEPLHLALLKLASIDAPVIASVHGVVAGAGVSLMLNADLAVAAEGTRFNLAYINIAASCDGGASFALPRITGLRNALEIALLGETLDAAQAQRFSLVNVVPKQSSKPKRASLRNGWRMGQRLRWATCAD
jgi:2-(1,2-epoxy-1,2-dihydrophenyl)acetyl-CoA isomerase